MITENETDAIYFSKHLKVDSRSSKVCKQISDILDSFNITYGFLPNTNDIWARDYMPIQVSVNKYIEYRYDPDYLQGKAKGRRDLKTYPDLVCDAIKLKTVKSNILLDGGNVVRSSNSIILTDKVVIENAQFYSREELVKELKALFDVDIVVLIPWDYTEEEYGHSDGMIRFIDNDTVLVQGYFDDYDDTFKQKLFGSLEQNGLKWEKMKFDVKKEDDNNWAYLNFLQTKDLILLPALGIDEDEQALEQIKTYFPTYAIRDRIQQINVSEIVKKGGGGLNCISWNIKL